MDKNYPMVSEMLLQKVYDILYICVGNPNKNIEKLKYRG
jgi:hypothetical protein